MKVAKTETRTCIRCGETKSLGEFFFEKRSGRYLNFCAACDKKYHKEYHERMKAKNAGKVVEVDPNKTKVCVKCGVEKPLTEFYVDSSTGKIINTCKLCKRSYNKSHYEDNKEYISVKSKEYREANKERLDAYHADYRKKNAEKRREYSRQYHYDHIDEVKVKSRIYRQTHKEEIRERDKKYAATHREQIRETSRKYRAEHREEVARYHINYRRERCKVDPLFKLDIQIRAMIRYSFKRRGYKKNSRTYKIVGCDFDTLNEHLRKTWLYNYGTEYNGEPYHIDHIIPLATAKTEKDVERLCHYTNLQLLKPQDNLIKKDKLDWALDKT